MRRVPRSEGVGELLIEKMRGVWAEGENGDLSPVMSLSLHHGNLRNALSKSPA